MTNCVDLTTIKNLEECMYVIALEDYPDRWPNALAQIGESILSEDSQTCYASLCALRAIIKKYQNKLGKERKPLLEISETAFDILESQFEKYLKIFDEPAVLIMTVLTKIFYLSNYVVLFLCLYIFIFID